MMSFTEKYSPTTVTEFLGQKSSLEQIDFFMKSNKGKKALLVHGPVGCGKTTAVRLIAEKFGYSIAEITPETMENAAAINDLTKTNTLFGLKKIILVDNVESFYQVRGAIGILMKMVKESIFPVVFIALDVWDQKLKYLRLGCETVQFRKFIVTQVTAYLKKIADIEKIKTEEGTIEAIAKNSDGDLRAALQDLELLATGTDKIEKTDLVLLQQRPKDENIFNAVQKIFKTTDINEASRTFENLDVDPGLLVLWLAENVPKEYSSRKEIADAYNFLSRSDVFMGRIKRQQHWEFFRYAMFLATAGVAVSKEHSSERFVKYSSPMKLSKLSQTKAVRTMVKEIAAKIAGVTHTSATVASRYYTPMIKILFKNDPEFKKNFAEKLALDKEELSFLSG